MLIKFNFPLIVKKMTTTAAGDEASALTEREARGRRRICGDRRKITASAVGLKTAEANPGANRLLSLSLAFLIRHCRPTQLAFAYLNLDFCTGCAWLAGFLGLDATMWQF
jgi:hypothetical protein